MKRPILLATALLLLAGCAAPSTDSEPARQTLIDFFDCLHNKQYTQADTLYGGSYETPIDHNPGIDPQDHAALWHNVCVINGGQCLTVRTATLKDHHDDTYIFFVEFSNADGSLFVRGPCCGATETEMPSESHFEFRVVRYPDGQFKVMDLPVYVP